MILTNQQLLEIEFHDWNLANERARLAYDQEQSKPTKLCRKKLHPMTEENKTSCGACRECFNTYRRNKRTESNGRGSLSSQRGD